VSQDEPAGKTTGLAEQGALAGTQEKKEGLPPMEARAGNSRGVQLEGKKEKSLYPPQIFISGFCISACIYISSAPKCLSGLCREEIRKARAKFEPRLATVVRDNKKCLHKCIINKKWAKESLHHLLDASVNIANKDEEKAEVLNALFASVFNSQNGYSQGSQLPVLQGREGERNKPPIIQKEAVNDMLCHLDTYTSTGPDGIHPRVLRELVEELAKTLSIIYQQSWLTGEVPDDWTIAIVTSIYKKGRKEDPGNYEPVSLTSVPGKIMEQFILSALTGHVKDNQGIRTSQHGFRKGTS